MHWNFGDIFDAVADAVAPGSPALLHGERVVGWDELARRSNNVAANLLARGARPDDKVALYLRNRPEYVELTVACMKARLVHVNVNFRYGPEEVRYILDNADARFVVFAGEFAELLDGIRGRLPQVRGWFQLDDGTPRVPFAERYEELAATGPGGRLD